MSSTKKVIIIFSGIFLASVIGMAITLGIIFGSGGFKSFGDIFQGYKFGVNESSGSIDLAGVSAVRIEVTSCDIHIVPSDVAKVELKGTVIPGKQEKYLKVSEQDGTLLIDVEDNSWSLFNIFNVFMDLDLTVYLPAGNMLDVTVYCTSGNIDMTGMKLSGVELRRTSGNTDIRDCSAESFLSDATSGDTKITSSELGSMKLSCRSGNMTVNGTTGSIYARATSGNINIADADGALDVGCTSGDVSLDVADAAGAMQTITAGLTSGNIRIYLPMGAAFDLEARTTSGNITSDLGIAVSGSISKSFSGENISGTCNGGGPLVNVSVTSGNISIIGK